MKIGVTSTEQLDGGVPFIVAENLPSYYVDITALCDFDNPNDVMGKDYKWGRKKLQIIDWDSATSDEKIIIARYKATSETNCKAWLGDDYDFWMNNFDTKSVACRTVRFSYAKTMFLKNVSLMDRYNVLGFMNTIPALRSNYIQDGIEGTSDGDPVDGFFNFVEATGGFTATGIAARTYTMINGMTKEEMVTAMMDCLRSGEYN